MVAIDQVHQWQDELQQLIQLQLGLNLGPWFQVQMDHVLLSTSLSVAAQGGSTGTGGI